MGYQEKMEHVGEGQLIKGKTDPLGRSSKASKILTNKTGKVLRNGISWSGPIEQKCQP